MADARAIARAHLLQLREQLDRQIAELDAQGEASVDARRPPTVRRPSKPRKVIDPDEYVAKLRRRKGLTHG